LCAVFLGFAIVVNEGRYDPLALSLLTIVVVLALGAVSLRLDQSAEGFPHRRSTAILVGITRFSICISTGILVYLAGNDRVIVFSVLCLGLLGFLLTIDLRAMRMPLVLITVAGFCV